MTEAPLGELLEVLIDHRGKTPKKLGSSFMGAGVPVVSAINIKGNRITFDGPVRCVSEEVYARWMPVPLRKGDVLLTSEAPLGEVALITSDEPLVLGQRLFGLRGRADTLSNAFLFYLLQWAVIRRRLEARSTGTTVYGIRQAELRRVLVPVPPLPEQNAIAEVLGAIDDKIAVNAQVVAACNALASALFSQAQRRSVPVGEVAQIVMGQSPPGSTYNETAEGLPFYQGTRDFGFRFPTRRIWCSAPTRMAEAGDVLVSVRAPVGRLNVATERCAIGRGVGAIRSMRYPSVVFHAMAADESRWAPFESEGTVFGSIAQRQLRELSILWPIDYQLDRLEDQLSELDSRLAAAHHESIAAVALRDTLLPRLLSGRAKILDADPLVEATL